MNTFIDTLMICITILLIFGTVIFILFYKIFPIIYKKEINKEKELELKKSTFYSTLDPNLIDHELDAFISKYIDMYIIKNIIINNIEYIKKDQIDEMVKNITKQSIMEMSELYLFYCKLLYNISDDDDLLNFIYYKVSDLVLNKVTEFNKLKE